METLEQLFEKIPAPGAFGPSFQIMISRHYGNEQWPNSKKWLCNISGYKKKFNGDTPSEAIKKALDWYQKKQHHGTKANLSEAGECVSNFA